MQELEFTRVNPDDEARAVILAARRLGIDPLKVLEGYQQVVVRLRAQLEQDGV